MKGGHAPIQIQRWAPYDYVNDPFVKRLYLERDYRTAAFYPAFLFHSFLEGGDLPSEPRALAAVVLMPVRDVMHAMAVCIEAGKLCEHEGRLHHKRVVAEVSAELEYRANQSELGKKGGRPPRKGYPKATVVGNQSPPSPSPLPTPSPITPPTPSVRGSRSARSTTHPETGPATDRLLLAFNGTFRRRATSLPKLREMVSIRLTQGYTLEQLACVPILADAQSEFADFRKRAQVHWFLRTGDNPKMGKDGKIIGAKDWIGDSLNAAFGTTLWPHHVEAAQAAGVFESLLKLGAKPSQ